MDSSADRCRICGSPAEENSRYCARCAASAVEADGNDDHEIADLLTSANLSRIRRNWDDAERDVKEALRLRDDSVPANILMGDILQDQDRLDEAAVWYQMAVNLAPDDQRAKHRLDDVKAQVRRRRGSRLALPGDASASASSPTLIRILTMFLGALAVLVLVFFLSSQLTTDRDTVPEVRRTYAPPVPERGRRSVQPPGGVSQPETDPSQATAPRATILTQPELGFLARLRAQPGMGEGGVTIETAQADPRQGSVTITAHIPNAARGVNTLNLLKQARAISQAAYLVEPQARSVTVRMTADLTDDSGNITNQLAFVGDITRDNANTAMAEDADVESYTRLFANNYWHPALRMQPAPARPS